MGVVTGTDTQAPPAGADPLLAGVRRLTLLADETPDSEAIFRALARELLSVPGAEEVQVHHLGAPGAGQDLVAVYLFEADGRLSYLLPSGRAPAGGELGGAAPARASSPPTTASSPPACRG